MLRPPPVVAIRLLNYTDGIRTRPGPGADLAGSPTVRAPRTGRYQRRSGRPVVFGGEEGPLSATASGPVWQLNLRNREGRSSSLPLRR